MKPAPSIIGFTTLSGLGYGMLFVLALGALLDVIPADRWFGIIGFILALGSITAGLLASTLHLGHPERAWRAISQWRSSWLSREGLLALLTYVPAVLFAMGWVFAGSIAGIMALASAVGAAATVYCTGMIYASLPPIKAWHQPLTAPIYLAFALMTGLLAVHVLMTLFGIPHRLIGMLTLISIVAAFALKILYWQVAAARASKGPTAASATGLGASGLVRMLDPPHTQTNYLLDEMGFQIGRKHARKLKMLTFALGLFVPLIMTLLAVTLDGLPAAFLALLAFLSGMIGILLERWLFFAEAEHSVMLYYSGRAGDEMRQTTSSSTAIAKTGPMAEPSPGPVPNRRRAAPKRRRSNIKGESVAAAAAGPRPASTGQPAERRRPPTSSSSTREP